MYEMSCNWGVGVTRVLIYLDEWVLTARSCYCSRCPQDNLNWACTCLRLAQPFCLNLSSPCLDALHNTFGSLWFGTDGVFYRAAQRRSFLSLLSQPSLMTGRIGIRGNKWTAVYSRQSGALGADAVSIYTFMSTCFLLNLLTDCFTLYVLLFSLFFPRNFYSIRVCIARCRLHVVVEMTFTLFPFHTGLPLLFPLRGRGSDVTPPPSLWEGLPGTLGAERHPSFWPPQWRSQS